MWFLTPRSVFMCLAISMAWVLGAMELWTTLVNFSTQWFWWVLATFFGVLLADLFFHLSLSHAVIKIDVNRITYKILAFLSTVFNSSGLLTRSSVAHDLHHMFADQKDKDVLHPVRMLATTGLLSPLRYIYQPRLNIDPDFYQKYLQEQSKKFDHILSDPWTRFLDRHTEEILLVTWLTLYLVAPIILFKIIFMGRFLISIYHAMSSFGHLKLLFGYRNFDTPDHSHNHIFFHYLTLGLAPGMLQNNHHGMDFTHSHRYRWFEIDTGSWIIRNILSPLMIKKS